ncbi:MAG TPA: sialidase family protein [Acidimicrobiales bacterium]|nr:sialidase family protein [Acidimicrobiales bacterium]
MRRTALGVVAAAVGLVVIVVVVFALTAPKGVKVGTNVLVNRVGPIDVRNSPTIARNPKNGSNLVTAYRMDRPGYSAFLSYSDNGGDSWEQTVLPLAPDVPTCAASPQGEPCPFGPDVAFGPDGTLYVLYVALRGTGNDPGSLWLSTSTDGGRTLALPAKVAGELAFQPRLAVDPKGPVYITWLQGFGTGNLSFTDPPPYVVAVRSDDKGRTFSPQVRVSDPARVRIGGASPVVDAKGRLHVVYMDYKDNRRDFSGLTGPPAELPFGLVFTTSTDGGKTFGKNVEIESNMTVLRRFLIYLPEFPQIAAGPGDNLYVTWGDGRSGDLDVLMRRSTDGGATWTDAVRVNDNPAKDGTAQFLPKVDVASDGRVNVLFLDGRNDPAKKILLDAYLATSTDGGKSFKNVRVSSQSFDSTVGPTFGTEYGTDFGTKLGLTSAGGKVYAAWTDTRLGSQATGRQDVDFATVDLGHGRSSALLAGGVVLVLLLGGGMFLALRSANRRSSTSARATPAARATTTPVDQPGVTGR